MNKFFYALLAFAFAPLMSCGTTETVEQPVGPQSTSSNMPWNRPVGPEGGGALGGVLNR